MTIERFNKLTPSQRAELEGAFMDYMDVDSLGIEGLPMPTIVLENLLHFADSNFDFDAKPLEIYRPGYLIVHNGEVVEQHTTLSYKKMENIIKQEISWYHIDHEMPEKGIRVYIGGEGCLDIAELVNQKGILSWKLYGRKGNVDLEKYPYWHYPEPPIKRHDSLQGFITPEWIRSK